MSSLRLAPPLLCAGALLAAGPTAAARLFIPFGPVADQQTSANNAAGQDVDIDIKVPSNTLFFNRLDVSAVGDLGFFTESLDVTLNGVSLGTILNNNFADDRFDFQGDGGDVDFVVQNGSATSLGDVAVRPVTRLSFSPTNSGVVDFAFGSETSLQDPFDDLDRRFTYAVAGGLTVTIPDVWISDSGGAFDDDANWEVGVSPTIGEPSQVLINPEISQTIEGPAGRVDVLDLELGAGLGRAELAMQGGAIVQVGLIGSSSDPEVAFGVGTNGVLSGAGTIVAVEGLVNDGAIEGDGLVIEGDVTNNGEIEATKLAIVRGDLVNRGEIDATDLEIDGRLDNLGEYRGGGDVGDDVLNDLGGLIEVGAGESLESSGGIANAGGGEIRLLGGALEAAEAIENFDGRIVGRDVKIDGAAGVNNSLGGRILLSGAANDIFGFVQNLDPDDGTVISNAGGGLLTFYDDVFNGAVIETLTGGRTVFLDGYAGPGALTGGGSFFMRGEFAPGSSPGLTPVTGNLTLTGTSLFELGGRMRGTDYDATDVSGVLTLGGDLEIVNFGSFLGDPGDMFTLFMASQILGDFDSILFPTLASGEWRTFRTATTFGVEAVAAPVPLPAAGWMLLAGLGALAAIRRRA